MSRYGTSARERAGHYAAILFRRKPQYGLSTDFGRSLDHCFESGDGPAVAAWIIYRIVRGDTRLVDSIMAHHPKDGENWWLTRVCLAWRRGDVATVRAQFEHECEEAKKCVAYPRESPRGITIPKWPGPPMVAQEDAPVPALFGGGA